MSLYNCCSMMGWADYLHWLKGLELIDNKPSHETGNRLYVIINHCSTRLLYWYSSTILSYLLKLLILENKILLPLATGVGKGRVFDKKSILQMPYLETLR